MPASPLLRRLEKIERQEAQRRGVSAPVVRIITENDEDARQQLAALEREGRYTPGSFVIDRRIIDPTPRIMH